MKAALVALGFIAFVAALVVGARLLQPVQPRPSTPMATAAAPPERAPPEGPLNPPLPALFVVRSDADRAPIALAGPRKKPMLLHLWASWCGPCIEELPSILALGHQGTYDVVAVSVDDRWPDVVRFFGGKIPPEIAWDPKITLEPTLGVSSLPTTFLVDTTGRLRARLDGKQAWALPAMTKALADALVDGN